MARITTLLLPNLKFSTITG